MIINAYAKINLTLDILNKREDGYHNLDSVFQTISLCDRVAIEKSDKISVLCDYENITENIAFKAAREFFEFSGINGGAEIKIEKHIPVLSGLGGGSADAAAVIIALNKIYTAGFDNKTLMKIAAKVGADVPFLILGGTARVGGIGENVVKLTPLNPYYVLLIKSGEKQSTKEMYRLADGQKGLIKTTQNFINSLKDGKFNPQFVANNFLSVYKSDDVLKAIKKTNPVCASLSGSGPTVFGLYCDEISLKNAEKTLFGQGYNPIIAKFKD